MDLVFESNGDLKRKRKNKDRVQDIDILAEITKPARKKRQHLDAHSRAQQGAAATVAVK